MIYLLSIVVGYLTFGILFLYYQIKNCGFKSYFDMCNQASQEIDKLGNSLKSKLILGPLVILTWPVILVKLA